VRKICDPRFFAAGLLRLAHQAMFLAIGDKDRLIIAFAKLPARRWAQRICGGRDRRGRDLGRFSQRGSHRRGHSLAKAHPHARQQLAGSERLRQIIDRAGVQTLDNIFLQAASADHNDWQPRGGSPKQLPTLTTTGLDLQQNHIERGLVEQ
jgi:hypothetical protein